MKVIFFINLHFYQSKCPSEDFFWQNFVNYYVAKKFFIKNKLYSFLQPNSIIFVLKKVMRIARISEIKQSQKQVEVDLSLLDPVIEKYKNVKGNMIPILQHTQELYGFVPKDAFVKISRETGLKLSDMYGVATFYAQFRLNPVGKHIIKVCHGTACHVQNANKITDALQEALGVKDGETTEDNLFTLESVACLGCCSLAPVMMIGTETYGKLTGSESVKIVKEIKIKELN